MFLRLRFSSPPFIFKCIPRSFSSSSTPLPFLCAGTNSSKLLWTVIRPQLPLENSCLDTLLLVKVLGCSAIILRLSLFFP